MYIHALRITGVSALLLGACAADADDPELTVDFATEAVQQEPTVSDVAAEAVALSQELAARLESRGYTWEDALAAAEAGDEARAREMFGYTDSEYAEWYARLEEIATAAESVSAGDAGYPEGWSCQPELIPCITSIGLAYLVRGSGISVPALLAYGGIHVAGCVYTYCSYDRTEPGPPVKKP